MSTIPALKPTLLLILDGFGLAPEGPGNAARLARTPNLAALAGRAVKTRLSASGRDVGLPTGFMGNSEVGHMNIGAGRIVWQDMTRIDLAIEEHKLAENKTLVELLAKAKLRGGRVHFLGLLSDGGVHSHITHIKALLELAANAGVKAFLHAFMDGRDTPPDSGKGFMQEIVRHQRAVGWGAVATVCGRYYAMDRDTRWERNEIAFNAMVHGKGQSASDPVDAVEAAYAAGETDEFIKPRVLMADNAPVGLISDDDVVFFFNFRADRARQMVRAFIDPGFAFYDRGRLPQLSGLATMTRYEADFDVPVAFEKEEIRQGMGEFVSSLGLAQLRIAETEKYAHVTYFFNCGHEDPFPNEERRLIPSPRDVATYDLKPAMSAEQVADTFIAEWGTGRYAFAVCNFANPDMVGHTGILQAAISAIEAIDACVGRVAAAVLPHGRLIITADHGNSERMLDADGKPHTAHTTNPVPFLVLEGTETPKFTLRSGGKLGDIAPTIIQLWNLQQPAAMTGQSLLNL